MATKRRSQAVKTTEKPTRILNARCLVRGIYDELCSLDRAALIPMRAAEIGGESALTARDARAVDGVLRRVLNSLVSLREKLTAPLDASNLDEYEQQRRAEFNELFGDDA